MKTQIAMLGMLAILEMAFSQENYSTWSKYKDITINTTSGGANVTGTVVNFPVLVRLTSANADVFTQALGGGADIRFANAAGTHLPYQIERWSVTDTSAAIWVLADTVKGNDSSKVRIYWGKSGVSDSSTASKVFDTANGFVSVWHLGDANGILPRPNAVVGGPSAQLRNFDSTYVPVKGVIGMADTLRSVNAAQGIVPTGDDYLDMGRKADFSPANYAGFSDFTGGITYSL